MNIRPLIIQLSGRVAVASVSSCQFLGYHAAQTTAVAFFCACLAAVPAVAQPAFPGAMGLGAAATGGRGGSVYHVTNLNDSGTGSLRDAVGTAGRIVVFDVGGYITLASKLSIKSNITLAGQTAPGGGIGIKGRASSTNDSSNIIIRHMRFRPGADSPNEDNGLSLTNGKNTILDHISVEFANWNNLSGTSDNWQTKPVKDITVQNSIVANPTYQQFGGHIECVEGTWTWIRNIWANGHGRQPMAKVHTIFVNNVIYDYESSYNAHSGTAFKHDVINNYWIRAANGGNEYFQTSSNQSFYVSGNLLDTNKDGTLNGSGIGMPGGAIALASPWSPTTSTIPTLTPAAAYKQNVSTAGALPRDEVDSLVVSQVKTLGSGPAGKTAGTIGDLYTHENQTGLGNGGLGTLASGSAPVDTDRDGMPNAYETALGWNAASIDHNTALANNGSIVTGTTFLPNNSPSGYTRMDEYLHFMSEPHATMSKNTALLPTSIDVDLRSYTGGFTASPTFAVSNVIGGAVTLSGTGNALMHFVPTVDTAGRAKFDFTVTDSAGTSWVQTFNVLVASTGLPHDLSWVGNGTTNPWDTSSALWHYGAAAATFAAGDNALFADGGSSSPQVNLTSTLVAGAVTVASAQNYTFGGTGALTAGPLVKSGSGSLTLANTTANSFASVDLDEGTLTLPSITAAGSAPISLTSGTLVFSPPANLTISNPLAIDGEATISVTTQHNHGAAWSGTGTANVNATALWTLTGNTSAFAGRVNLGATSSNLRLFGSLGSPLADWDLGTGSGKLYNRNGNVTIDLGSLAGGPNTQLLGAGSVDIASTYSIGALGGSMTFSGSIKDGTFGPSAKTNIIKTGSGALTLTGTNTFTGTTAVNQGKLLVPGTLPSSAVTIASGATLAANAVTGTVANSAGGILSPGAAASAPVVMNVGAGLTLNNPTIYMDMANTPAGVSDKIVMSSGTLALTGAINFQFLPLTGPLGAGTYDLVIGATNSSASSVTMTHNFPTGTRQTFSLSRPSAGSNPSYIRLVVANDAGTLAWTGAGSGIWDLNTTANNWLLGAASANFYNLDTVNFTDASAIGTVNLTGTLAPYLATVSNSATAYTFSGSGVLGGAAMLSKTGAGTLTIGGTGIHTFTGGTTLTAGTLMLDTAVATPLGTGVVNVNGGTLHLGVARSVPNSVVFSGTSVVASTSGNVSLVSNTANRMSGDANSVINCSIPSNLLTIQGPMDSFLGTINMGTSAGTLRLNGNINATYGSPTAAFDLGTGIAKLCNRNGDITVEFGAISGGSNTTLQGRQSGSTATSTSTYLIGGRNTDAVFAGHIDSGGDQTGLYIVKVGTGTWTLSGTSSYTGTLTAQQGRVILSGPLTCSGTTEVLAGAIIQLGNTLTTEEMIVAAGGQLTGVGTVAGDLTNNGTVNCTGPLTVTGDVTNNGLMRLTGGAALNANGAFINNGTLDLLTGGQSLPANFVNHGVVLDSSLVRCTSASRSGVTFTATIQGYPGHVYQFQRANSLSPANWINVGSPQSPATNNQTLTFTDPSATGTQCFYRITLTP
ncbi:MAG: autotransporter-associated beta strand repeat-containing protein [Luteolibacter sp.]|uniref:autotransporter-associated beta strand repeat-containing protein n=1 Tax=Luteolibacter sp. TaxID=1962973 RepID=UPI003264E244